MKKIKITMALALLVSAISFSSCGKKDCRQPHGQTEKPGCHPPPPPPLPPPPPVGADTLGE